MLVDQISVFLENKAGRLAEVTSILGEANVNIRALSLADTSDFGILRLIVSNPEMAVQVLHAKEFATRITKVIAVEIVDEPGGLSKALKSFEENGINVEYMYAFVEKREDRALMIFRVEDAENAVIALTAAGVPVLSNRQVLDLCN